MKEFKDEKSFVEEFSANVKNGETEFAVNGTKFECTGMEKNSSKQAVYAVKLDGQTVLKKFTMPGLKKVLGVAYTAPRNFGGGEKTGKRAGQKLITPATFAGKTDDELRAVAIRGADEITAAVAALNDTATKYGLTTYGLTDPDFCHLPLTDRIFRALSYRREQCRQTFNVADRILQLTNELQEAAKQGDFTRAAQLSAQIATLAK